MHRTRDRCNPAPTHFPPCGRAVTLLFGPPECPHTRQPHRLRTRPTAAGEVAPFPPQAGGHRGVLLVALVLLALVAAAVGYFTRVRSRRGGGLVGGG